MATEKTHGEKSKEQMRGSKPVGAGGMSSTSASGDKKMEHKSSEMHKDAKPMGQHGRPGEKNMGNKH